MLDLEVTVATGNASAKMHKFSSDVEYNVSRSASQANNAWQRAAGAISNNTVAMGGVVVGVFRDIGGKAGIAGIAVTALVGGMTALAQKAAETGQSFEAAQFEATFDNLSKAVDNTVVAIGTWLLPLFNRVTELAGLAPSLSEIEKKREQQRNRAYEKFKTDNKEEFALAQRILEIKKQTEDTRLANMARAENERRAQEDFEKNVAEAIREKNDKDFEESEQKRWEAIQNRMKAEKDYAAGQARAARALADIDAEIARLKADDRRKIKEDQEKAARAVEAFEKKQFEETNEIVRTLGGQFNALAGAIFSADTASNRLLRNIISLSVQLATAAFTGDVGGGIAGIGSFITSFFANGGIVGAAANGRIVRRPALYMVGEGSKPEAIVPLAADKRAQRESVMQQAGLAGSNGAVYNIVLNNVQRLDPLAARTAILPALNRSVRRGERLYSSRTIQ